MRISGLSESGRQVILDNLSQTGFSDEQKEIIILGLLKIIKDDKVWDPDKNPTIKEFAEFKESSFFFHEVLITLAYGIVEPYATFKISDNSVEALAEYLLNLQTVNISNLENHVHNNLWLSDYENPKKNLVLGENLIFFDFKMNNLIRKLHKALRSQLATYIKSPFSIVNTKAWITKPGTDHIGPNERHTDKFAPGHVKVMIYLTPLTDDYGKFWIEGNFITSKEPGAGVVFRNSVVLHSGIPGLKYPRICLEITIFRSFIDSDQNHDSHPKGKHYIDISTPYRSAAGLFV